MRVHLVSPTFHGYADAIAASLARLGHLVTVHHYDRQGGVGDKLRTKVRFELPDLRGGDAGWRAQQGHLTALALERLRAARPDLVLGIKTDALTLDFWAEARALGARTHLWLYDEQRRMRLEPGVLDAVDLLTSYSRGDTEALAAAGYAASHVANGFDARLPHGVQASGAFVFVGARYPNREALLTHLHERGVPVRAVGRDWSRHPVDRVRTWDPRRPRLDAQRDVPRSTAYALMAGALGNVNMHHDQDGFTMRTFEAPGVGGLQLIDRPDVEEFYEPGREVLVYSSPDELVELCERVRREPGWARGIAEAGHARTMAEHTFDHRAKELERLWR